MGLCPELNVSSFGDTPDEAERSLGEAVEAFIEGCILLGTLDEVLRESGFETENGPASEEVFTYVATTTGN